MRRVLLALVYSAVVVGVLVGASIASAESEPPPTEIEGAPTVEVGPEPGWLVTGEGEVVYEEGETAARGVGCYANVICIYEAAEYNKPYGAIECSYGGNVLLSVLGYSATNRCGNKTNWLRVNANVIACMNPGGNRPNPGGFSEVFVAKEYGAFC